MAHIRVESHGRVARDVKVFYVEGDKETDISNCVHGVDIHLAVGELATATLRTILGEVETEATIPEVVS